MINSWAAAAQAMINKNADSRLVRPDRRRGRWRATGPRSGADTGLVLCLTLGRQAARGCVDQAKTVADALLRYRQRGV